MKQILAFVLLTLMASASHAQQGGCAGVATSSKQLSGSAFSETFSSAEVLDIDVSVLFTPGAAKQLSGDHVIEIRFFNPRMNLYQSVSIPITADTSRLALRRIPGYPHPMKAQLLTEIRYRNSQFFRATLRLPVAGTLITRNSMYGTWTADVWVDGKRLKCAKEAKFEILE